MSSNAFIVKSPTRPSRAIPGTNTPKTPSSRASPGGSGSPTCPGAPRVARTLTGSAMHSSVRRVLFNDAAGK